MEAMAEMSKSIARPDVDTQDTPPLLRTYSLAYALGALFLAIEMFVLGTQSKYAFTDVYMIALVMPPVLTALSLLLVDRYGKARTLPLRMVVLTLVASVVSIISTVVLTPFLILMFREGVGRNLSATGALSAVSLAIVSAPLVVELVRFVKAGLWLRAALMVAGLIVVAVALSMALAPTGPLASSMRLDQGELLMITSSWWLPVYALSAAYARRFGMA